MSLYIGADLHHWAEEVINELIILIHCVITILDSATEQVDEFSMIIQLKFPSLIISIVGSTTEQVTKFGMSTQLDLGLPTLLGSFWTRFWGIVVCQ